jgi:hypothetical protein
MRLRVLGPGMEERERKRNEMARVWGVTVRVPGVLDECYADGALVDLSVEMEKEEEMDLNLWWFFVLFT